MTHLSEGVLRQVIDEPLTLTDFARRHLAACARCQKAMAHVRSEANIVSTLLAPANATVDVSRALQIVRGRLHDEPEKAAIFASLMGWKQRTSVLLNSYRIARPIGVAVGVAAIAAAIVLTPASSWAQSLLAVFQPNQVVAIQINPNDLQTLPKLDEYGDVSQPSKLQTVHVNDSAAANQTSGMQVLQPRPGSLPSDVTMSPHFVVIPAETSTFTFSAKKASAAAAAAGKAAPRYPSAMDGSKLTVSVGPVVVTVYGGPESLDESTSAARALEAKQGASPEQIKASQKSGGTALPSVVIAQAKTPAVSSTGVSVADLEQFLLSQPGVSPTLAKAIRSIGDPNNPIPLPIPIVRGSSHPVRVQDVPGIAISDPTGLNAIIWQKNGVVYNVGGTLSESQLLTIAASLG